jgi:hypothetical protein
MGSGMIIIGLELGSSSATNTFESLNEGLGLGI